MKNSEIGIIIGGGLLLAGGGLLLIKNFYKHHNIKPDDYNVKTSHNERIINTVYPDPKNPVKFNIPEDYGIGHQRGDQETYHSWYNRSDSSGGKRTKRKHNKRKTNKRKTKSAK